MSNGSNFGSQTNQELLDILKEGTEPDSTQFVPDIIEGTTGSPLYDFIGQAVWKAADEATFGSLGAFDAVSESVKGDAADTWEETLAFGAEGDWEELSNAGKAGAMVGRALGMIPQFFAGGLLTKTAVKGLFGIKNVGSRMAAARSISELVEAGKKLPVKKGIDVSKSLTDDAARTIIDDAYEISSAASDISKLEGGISREIFEESLNEGVKGNLRKTLEIADEELLEGISRETVRIVTKNNPENAEALLQMAASRLPMLGRSDKASHLLGAMLYDGAIGLAMGSMRVGVGEIHAATLNVRKDEFGDYKDIGIYDFNAGDVAKNWWHDAIHEAFVFMPFGAVKHINPKIFGGKSTGASHGKRLFNIIGSSTKAYWKPLKKYTNKELRMQLTAMDEIAGGTLNTSVGRKFASLAGRGKSGNRQWWIDATTDDDTKLMREFLGEIRKKYVLNAPRHWATEFGVDALRSLPRMAAGVVAMNSAGLVQSFRNNGFNAEALRLAMGQSPEEISANIFTAMYFTRKPHSFNMEATPGMFKRMFETGQIQNYRNAKLSKLRKIVGGLNTFGADQKGLQRIIMNYGHYDIREGKDGQGDLLIKKTLDSSKEFNELQTIFKPFQGEQRTGTTDLKTAFNKRISDMVKNGDLTYEESLALYDNLFIAEKIIGIYNNNTRNKLPGNNFTPQEAFEIVQKVSSIKFNNKLLSINDPDSQIEDWMERVVDKATFQPQQILKEYLVQTYEALDIPIQIDPKGPMKAPDIRNVDLGNRDVEQALSYLYSVGVKNNWIERSSKLPAELKAFDGETQRKAQEVWNNSVDQMMALVYGEKWSNTHEVDPNILVNDVWAITHNDLLLRKQRFNAYELFTGGNDHNTTGQKALAIQDAVDNFMRSKKAPKVEKGDRNQENYGEIEAFVRRLHSAISALHPDNIGKERRVMTQDEASGLMESVREATGDLFMNSDNSRQFELYALNKSMSRLGINDMVTGIDAKASLYTLMQDPNINYQTEGTKTILPDSARIKSTLQAAYDSKKISKETYDELLRHYTEIHEAVVRSGFPVDFRSDVLESEPGQWQKSITKSLANGLMIMDEMSGDRARRATVFLDNQAQKLDMLVKQIRLGADNISDANREKYKNQLQDLVDSREQTLSLSTLIKTAVKERDIYTLRAVGRKEGDIRNAIDALSKDPFESDKSLYKENLLRIHEDIKNKAHFQALNESTISDFIKEQLSQYHIREKDLKDTILKVTTSQFSNKYKMSIRDIDQIFEVDRSTQKSAKEVRNIAESILGDYYDNTKGIKSPELRGQINRIAETLKNLSGDIVLDSQNFNNFVVKPLKIRMAAEVELMEKRIGLDIMDADLYAITSSYFSKVPIKTLKIDLSTNQLVQDYRPMGDAPNRGLTAILRTLDPDQSHIYLADIQGIDVNGNVIRNINGFPLNNVNSALKSGEFTIDSPRAKSDFYRHDDVSRMFDVNKDVAIQKETYKLIPINWNTSIVLRTDKYQGSIHSQIQKQFRGPDSANNDLGGELFRRLEAIYDGNIGQQTPQGQAIRNLLKSIRRAETDEDLTEAIKLTRAIFNMPSAIHRIIDNGAINLDHSFVKDRYKRDLLTETKNGYIPTDGNREKTALIYRNSNSLLYQNAYNRIRPWLEPDANGQYRKLRTLSIDDEGVLRDRDGKEIENPFDSLSRARFMLDQRRALNENDPNWIDQETYNLNIKDIEAAKKSIVDGEMFLSTDAYLAGLSMIGLHPDMVRLDANFNVIGFKSGALKPTISYSDVNFDRNSPEYGRVQEWFGKTAWKHSPIMNDLMNRYGVDAITFKSANKINTLKTRANESYSDRYTILNPDHSAVQDNSVRSLNWNDYLSRDGVLIGQDRIVEIPLESMSFRGVSREHDSLVGSNTGVHMNHDNGVADWIGLEAKIQNYNGDLASMYTNAYHRTALAQKVFGARADAGDPSVVNSAMSSILTRNGLIVEPWAVRKLEENMIGYYMNSGVIAGGLVPDGSLDVMSADIGNLGITIRSSIGDRPTVQFFGDYLPSYYAAQKYFKFPNQELNGVHNALIQRINYHSEKGPSRSADAFMIDLDGKKFLQVEGRYIDSEGVLRDADTFLRIENQSNQMIGANKRAFISSRKKENDALDQMRDNYGDQITLNDAALFLESSKLSIGMLNSRQPRNMMGDIVISKMAIIKDKDGNRVAHVEENSGNISRMNFVDAIKPQDADFDFDKSFNYVAAPGKFWREANRLAGYITKEQQSEVLDRFFDPNLQVGSMSKTIADLLGNDFTNDQVMYEVDAARGRFVKMHQTATYLANIFRRYPTVLEFEQNFIEGANKTVTVELNSTGRYPTVISNISKMVKRFIDVNKALPSKQTVDQINDIQNKLFFGYTAEGRFHEGLFEIKYKSTKGDIRTINEDLNDPKYRHIRDAINIKLISPINKYLKYNRGLETDQTGAERQAKIENYSKAYNDLLQFTLDPTRVREKVDARVNMEAGIRAAVDYFSESRNPYDIAMRGLHNIHSKLNIRKEEGSYGKGRPLEQDIIDYIEGGYEGFPKESREAVHNRVFNKALRNYVFDEARMLRLVDLNKQKQSLEFQIEKEGRFIKNTEESQLINSLKAKLDRVNELKTSMEEVLSYQFRDNVPDPPETIRHKGYKSGIYRANFNSVIVDASGRIKEVVLANNRNFNPIYKTDKIIKNGRRFEVTNGEEQKGLRILHEAFSGLPLIHVDGGWKKLSSYEARNFVEKEYRRIWSDLIKLKGTLDPERGGVGRSVRDYAVERERLLYDALFNNPKTRDDVMFQKALILRMLMPEISDKIISVRSINENSSKKAVYDYVFRENSFNEPIISLLSKIASGEHKGDREFAKQVLDDVNFMKNAALITTENGRIDIDVLTSRLFTEPASLEGIMTQEKYLSKDVFDQQQSQNEITRDAARVMIDYATGKRVVDPVILYKASREMSKKNIPIDQQWGRREHLSNEDGSVREFGIRNVLIPEVDAIRRKDLGDRGGNQESTPKRMRSIAECYLKR